MRTSRKPIFLILTAFLFLTACIEELETEPTLKTINAVDTEITATTAILKGEILTLGNMNIIGYGIEVSKSLLFTSPLRKGLTSTPVTGVFQVELTGLEPGTLYHFRAYVLINTAYLYPGGIPPNFTTK